MNEDDDLFAGEGEILDIDIDFFTSDVDENQFPSYAELDDIFDIDDSAARAAMFSIAQDTERDLLLLEGDGYDIDIFSDFVDEVQSRGLGLQKHKVIDQASPDTIGREKEYSMFLTRLGKITNAISDPKKMDRRGTMLIEGLISVIKSPAVQLINDDPFEHDTGSESFPLWLSKTFGAMHTEDSWNIDTVYEKATSIFFNERRRLSDDDKLQLRKELEILAQKACLILDLEKDRSVYNRPEIDNIACFFSPDSLICECGGRSEVHFNYPIVPLTAMIITTLKNKKHQVVVANPPYRCRDCGDFICLPEIFVDNVEQVVKEMIQDLKINFKGIAFYRPNLQELMQRLPPELSSLLKEEKGVILAEEFEMATEAVESDDYLNLYKTLVKRFVGGTKFYIDFIDFETFVASAVQTLETFSIFTLSYEIYVLEDERRMNLEQTLLWMQDNLARIAGVKYFTRRITLGEVLPPVLILLQKAYNLRYLVDHGNFKKPLESMKVVLRERPKTDIPYAALWDYYTYLQVLSSDEVLGLSITDYYWSEEEKLPLAKPMSHKYGYTGYKQLLMSDHIWRGFESGYFDTSKLSIHFELLFEITKDRREFLSTHLYPLSDRVPSPTIEKGVSPRLVAAHKIARLIEIEEETYIGEVCYQLRDTVSYMQIVSSLLADTSFVEESLPLRIENRGLFNELDNNFI